MDGWLACYGMVLFRRTVFFGNLFVMLSQFPHFLIRINLHFFRWRNDSSIVDEHS